MAPSRLALALAKHLANIYDARNWRAINNDSGQAVRGKGVQWATVGVDVCATCIYVFTVYFFCMLVSGLHAGAARSRAVADLVTARQVGKARH